MSKPNSNSMLRMFFVLLLICVPAFAESVLSDVYISIDHQAVLGSVAIAFQGQYKVSGSSIMASIQHQERVRWQMFLMGRWAVHDYRREIPGFSKAKKRIKPNTQKDRVHSQKPEYRVSQRNFPLRIC
jgi:hypothetical protein